MPGVVFVWLVGAFNNPVLNFAALYFLGKWPNLCICSYPGSIFKNTNRERGSTALYTVYNVDTFYPVQSALHPFYVVVCMLIYIARDG